MARNSKKGQKAKNLSGYMIVAGGLFGFLGFASSGFETGSIPLPGMLAGVVGSCLAVYLGWRLRVYDEEESR